MPVAVALALVALFSLALADFPDCINGPVGF